MPVPGRAFDLLSRGAAAQALLGAPDMRRPELATLVLLAACGPSFLSACGGDPGGGDPSGVGGTGPGSEAESDDPGEDGGAPGDTCIDAADCDDPPGDCAWAVCREGACAVEVAEAGAPATRQQVGDCRIAVCDGEGGTRDEADPLDVPRPLDTCSVGACDGDVPILAAAPEGTLCGEAGLLLCDGEGRCAGCEEAADCGPDAACFTRTCDGGICGVDLASAGTTAADPAAGDCRVDVCDGEGGLVTGEPSDDPPPDDADTCSDPVCVDGAAVDDLAPEGTACSAPVGGDGTCDGAGACVVGCRSDADCGVDGPCRDVACDVATGACRVDLRPAGAVVEDPASGDCLVTVCDGAGEPTAWPDDEETPVFDGNECTADVCAGGSPYPLELAGTACTSGACDGAGLCVVRPFVLTTMPYDTEERQSPLDPVIVTFSEPMDGATLTSLTDPMSSACTGTVQISEDDFESCVPVQLTVEGDGAVLRAVPAPALSHGQRMKLRVTGDAWSSDGRPLLRPFGMESGWTTSLDRGAYDLDGSVVIAEVYAGGGEAGGALGRDHVVLHNRGNEPVSLGSYSLQARRGDGSWQRIDLAGTLAPGGHLLVGLAGSGGAAADVEADVALAGGGGALALMAHQDTLSSGSCPVGDDAALDLVGWGSSPCAEGTPAPPIPPARAAARAANGCADGGDGAVDFVVEDPRPRASADPAWFCLPPDVLNETGSENEIDACSVAPGEVTAASGATVAVTVLAEEAGVTDGALVVAVGVGDRATNPQTQPAGWSWTDAVRDGSQDGAARFRGSIVVPAEARRGLVARVSRDGGASWTYCDADGAGADADLRFDLDQVGRIATE